MASMDFQPNNAMDYDPEKAARKQAEWEARRQHVLNPAARGGVDLAAIQAQAEEKRAREQAERDLELRHDYAAEEQMRQMAEYEAAIERQKMEEAAETRNFNASQRKEERRDWAINNTSGAIDLAMTNEEAGPGAMRFFDGEDRDKKDREMRQLAQLRDWAEEGARERRAREEEEARAEAQANQDALDLDQRIFDYERDIQARRAKELREARDFNLRLAEEKRERERLAAIADREADRLEREATSNSAFMTESRGKSVRKDDPSRLVTTEFKGMTHAQIEAIKQGQHAQIEAKRAEAIRQAKEDARFEEQQRQQRNQMADWEARVQSEQAQQHSEHRRFLLEQMEEQRRINAARAKELDTNTPEEGYFGQFGTSTR